MNSHSLPGKKLGDYCDGRLYHTTKLFQEDPCALQIQLYYDEVEVCNPIGSKVKKHKLGIKLSKVKSMLTVDTTYCVGLVYYSLGNIDPKYRSSLKSIQW